MRTTASLLLGAGLLLCWNPRATAQTVLVLQDNDPWGYSYWWESLAALGLSGFERDHTFIATENLEIWDLVIVPSQQPTVFNDEMETHMFRFEDYLDRGGRMILMLAGYQADDPIEVLPFGAAAICDPSTSSDTVHNGAIDEDCAGDDDDDDSGAPLDDDTVAGDGGGCECRVTPAGRLSLVPALLAVLALVRRRA